MEFILFSKLTFHLNTQRHLCFFALKDLNQIKNEDTKGSLGVSLLLCWTLILALKEHLTTIKSQKQPHRGH